MLCIGFGMHINHNCFQRHFNSLWITMKALIVKLYACAHAHTHIHKLFSHSLIGPTGAKGPLGEKKVRLKS